MKLRTQLLWVGLSVLILPWAGWQSVRQMEMLLRDGQSDVLVANAQMLARAVALRQFDLPRDAQSFFVHDFNSAPQLDGDGAEWGEAIAHANAFVSDNGKARAQVAIARNSGRVFILVQVQDPSVAGGESHWPETLSFDAVELSVLSAERSYEFQIAARQTGPVLPVSRSAESGSFRPEAFWRTLNDGYAIEIMLPLGVQVRNVQINVRDGDGDRISKFGTGAQWWSLHRQTASITSALQDLTAEGVRVRVIDRNSWVLARSGQLQADQTRDDLTPWRRWLYRAVLIDKQMPRLEDDAGARRATLPGVDAAFGGEAQAIWSQDTSGQRLLMTAIAPVRVGAEVRAVVVAQRSNASALLLTDQAISQLLGLTALAFLATTGLVLLFATRLSWRIRALRDATSRALDAEGRVHQFAASKSADEIGDLSRSYSRLLDEVAAYTEYLRTLAGKLSHELNTPLAIVRTSLDNLDQSGVSAQANTYLIRARDGVDRMNTLVRQMSEVTRIERAIESAEAEQFDIKKLLGDLAEAYAGLVAPRQLRLIVPDTPVMFYGSADLIVQALDKLIDNARSFCTESGWIEIELQTDAELVLVKVSNSGPLIPEAMRPRLFDSLVSLRDKSRNPEGSVHLGFGLYVVRLITELHQGHAEAYNRAEGDGVSFVLRLKGMRRNPAEKPASSPL